MDFRATVVGEKEHQQSQNLKKSNDPMKYIVKKYYAILMLIILYLVFNITIRDVILNWIINPNPQKDITINAYSYANFIIVQKIFIYSLYISMMGIALISIILLWSKKRKSINIAVLIIVPILILLLFFVLFLLGGFTKGGLP